MMNRKGADKDSLTGVLGVSFDKQHQKYRARIRIDKTLVNLGYFNDTQSAFFAYAAAAYEFFGQNSGIKFSNYDLESPEFLAARKRARDIRDGVALATDNTTGFTGVYLINGKFEAQFSHDKKNVYIATYSTAESAAVARHIFLQQLIALGVKVNDWITKKKTVLDLYPHLVEIEKSFPATEARRNLFNFAIKQRSDRESFLPCEDAGNLEHKDSAPDLQIDSPEESPALLVQVESDQLELFPNFQP
jgi:hypothetical protein